MKYEYECPKCEEVFEVSHAISEIDNPSLKTLEKITCHCPEGGTDEDIIFKKVIMSAPSIGNWNSKTDAEKTKMLSDRSKKDYKKNIEERKMDMQGSAVKQLKNLVEKK